MAMLSENINRAIDDFDNIQQAIINKGIDVPDTTPTSQYPAKIGQISGGEPSVIIPKTITANGIFNASDNNADGFNPVIVNVPIGEITENPLYEIADNIIENDTSGYIKKYIVLISDSSPTKALSFTNAYVKPTQIITSDGVTYNNPTTGTTTWSFSHTWDVSKDIEVSTESFKVRWIMVQYSNTLVDTTTITLVMPDETLYLVIDTIKFSITNFSSKRLLRDFRLLNDSDLSSTVTSMLGMFKNCNSLNTIPLLNTSNVTIMESLLESCYTLKEIPLLDTSNVTNMYSMFASCFILNSIVFLDVSKVTNLGLIFSSCYSMIQLNLKGAKVTLPIASTTYGLFLNRSSLLFILNNLTDLTGLTTQTLTMGTVNLAKLTLEERTIATNKNWTLA